MTGPESRASADRWREIVQLTERLSGSGPPNIFTTLGQHLRLFSTWLYYSAHDAVRPAPAGRRRAGHSAGGHAEHASIDGLTERQRTLLAVTDDLLEQRAISEPTGRRERATSTDRDLIELCLLNGHYQGLASAIGGLGIEPEITQSIVMTRHPLG